MQTGTRRWLQIARAVADAVPAILLATMFLCFIIQVFMRYAMDSPVGWTVEVCVIAWLWILLWGQSVAASEDDEIRFDLVYSAVSPSVRRWFRLIFSIIIVGVYVWSLPALWDYVTFMRIQKTSYLDIPFNWVYGIAMIFSVVSILRYAAVFWLSASGRDGAGRVQDLGTSRNDGTS